MSLESAVRKTIEYAHNFQSHINKNEIIKRLISKRIYPKNEIEKEIAKLNWKNKKNKWGKTKLAKAKKISPLIKNRFKEILFMGISGSVATAHPKKNDDIDMFIITKANTLWKNRLRLRWWIFTNKIPHRKFNQTESKDQFCFNLWLDENYLEIPKTKQKLKNAIDLVSLKPLINNNRTYEKLLIANNWAAKFVATPYKAKMSNIKFLITNEKQKTNKFEQIINYLYFWPQYLYMRPRISKEKVNPYQAFFHR